MLKREGLRREASVPHTTDLAPSTALGNATNPVPPLTGTADLSGASGTQSPQLHRSVCRTVHIVSMCLYPCPYAWGGQHLYVILLVLESSSCQFKPFLKEHCGRAERFAFMISQKYQCRQEDPNLYVCSVEHITTDYEFCFQLTTK